MLTSAGSLVFNIFVNFGFHSVKLRYRPRAHQQVDDQTARMAVLEHKLYGDEKPEVSEDESHERSHQVIDRNRDTFLPRPSDDPQDPLNWALSLKVSIVFSMVTKSLECAEKYIYRLQCLSRSLFWLHLAL